MRMHKIWTIRLLTSLLWLLAAASVVYWALKFVGNTSTPANAMVVGAAPSAQSGAVDTTAVAKALGGGFATNVVAASASSTVPSGITASRFVLTGIVDGKAASKDIALIAIDAKPARPYRIGNVLESGVVLLSVAQRKAVIGPQGAGATGITLELPPRPVVAGGPAAVGVLPATPPVAVAPPPPAAIAAPVVTPPAPNATQAAALSATSAVDAAAIAAARAGAVPGQMQGRFGANRQRPTGAAGAVPAPVAGTESGEFLQQSPQASH